MTDDAYVMTRKEDNGYQVSMEWIAKTQEGIFREYASNSDNGTWNKSGFLKHARLSLPSYEEQLEVVEGGK